MRRILLIILALILIISARFMYDHVSKKLARERIITEVESVKVPSVESRANTDAVKKVIVKDEVNWDVPFTSQAPHANWDPVHENACEEASLLMALRYFNDQTIKSPDDAERGLQAILKTSDEKFGYGLSITAQEASALLAAMNKRLTISVVGDVNEQAFKRYLSAGNLIIVPAVGALLQNPYFQDPPPHYHMLVIRGYTRDGYVITNDPGTKRGEEFLYRWETLLPAIRDWNNGSPETGEPTAIVVGEEIRK